MKNIVSWDHVHRERWSYQFREKHCHYIVYKLEKLPDFTNHRFEYLCKENDNRQAEVAKKQLAMIRQFHGLGAGWAISFRLQKQDGRIVCYLVFRFAGDWELSEEERKVAENRIHNALMRNEYSFQRVAEPEVTVGADSLLWANEAAEVTKLETEYQGDQYPNGDRQSFYSPFAWTATDNSMESICSALMNHAGQAVVEVVLIPTAYLDDEKSWVGYNISMLRDCMNGETFKSKTGRVIWQGKKLPTLKTPLENFEKLNKQYEASRVFLSSIRVFSDTDAETLANAFLLNSAKNEGTISVYRRGYKGFEYLLDSFSAVDIPVDAHTFYWNKVRENIPYRAQRLVRLCSVEEIANFFRIPIPIRPGFPGFSLDTGLGGGAPSKKERSIIKLGSYLDESHSSDTSAQFDSQHLAKHGLIVGVPGSGKTTAMFNILYQLWAVPDEQKIPFIILEPAKTEYRALKLLEEFKEDMLVFSLGDESVSPFRFNPMEVLPGAKIESHISKLQACFVGAFDLFDPLPVFLEQAIRRTYLEKGWYEDSVSGEPGLETPTLTDLCRNAEYIVSHSGFDSKMRSDFQASLLERLNSLRRGSKGRMLDTKHSIPAEELMQRPVVLELDSLNGDEKALIMMFLLTYVFEYCKVNRKSGSPLKHMLLVEEAHNLIGASGGSEYRADPKSKTIELFVNMLAEMRALGQGILIADQLPTAIAPQAVKQTNVKILMRVTAKDDREEIGNTMDLNEEQMHQVINFKTGHAYLYHEGEDRVRAIRMLNFKGEHDVEEPPSDEELKVIMASYERSHGELFMPFPECHLNCVFCNRRVRNQAESFVQQLFAQGSSGLYQRAFLRADQSQLEGFQNTLGMCGVSLLLTQREAKRILERYHTVGSEFGGCVYVHLLNKMEKEMDECRKRQKGCACREDKVYEYLEKFKNVTKER